MFLICGEALFDVFVEAGNPDSGMSMEARAGGSPYNVAVGLARLEQPVALLTGLSRDSLGERLARQLTVEGVVTSYLVRTDRRTTLSLVGVGATGSPDYTFYGAGSADCDLTPADMPTVGDDISALHFGSYSIAVAPVAGAFASLAQRESRRFISLDPNVRPTVEPDMTVWRRRVEALAQLASLIKVSSEDLSHLYPGASDADLAGAWLAKGVALVVVTDGERGATAWSPHHKVQIPASSTTVVDTVGAGDAFQAALLHTIARHRLTDRNRLAEANHSQLAAMLTYAGGAAAYTCARRGADLPRLGDFKGG